MIHEQTRQKTAQDEHKTLKSCMRFKQIFWWIYTIYYTGLLLLLKWCDISTDIRGLICFIRSSISQLRSPCFELSLSPHTESKQNEADFAYSALTRSEALRVLGQRRMIKTLNIWAIIPFFLAAIRPAWWNKVTKNILGVHVKYVISTLEGRNVWSWNFLLKIWLNIENISNYSFKRGLRLMTYPILSFNNQGTQQNMKISMNTFRKPSRFSWTPDLKKEYFWRTM
jgi:hypothetical protein